MSDPAPVPGHTRQAAAHDSSAKGSITAGPGAMLDARDPEVLDDGQEEVFSRTAVERGVVEDPKALGPEDLARAPRSPGSLLSPNDPTVTPDGASEPGGRDARPASQ